jgi:cyclic pyranopterin phosphate synthase
LRDSYGREITYLRVSVTDRCNLRCVYCMPASGVPLLGRAEILSYEQIALVARAASRLGFRKVRLTGGEPLARRGVESLVSLLARIPGIDTLAMTTNGTLLAPLAAELRRRGLRSVNVSLDTLDPGRYAELTRGGCLEEALEGVRAAVAAGLLVKLNVVMLEDTKAAEVERVRAFAAGIGTRVQTIARYRLDRPKRDGGAYDRPPPCGRCDRLRLLADGRLRPCLHGAQSAPVDWNDLEGSIRRAVAAKPRRGLAAADLAVGQIGG